VKSTTFVAIVLFVLIALIAPAVPAKDIVQIRMRGFIFPAPATIPVTVAVEPDANNRMLVVEADGDSYFRSSATPLDGADEKRLHLMEFKSVPAGSYVVRARVLSRSAVLGTASEELVVTGAGAER
jgi:hypothetical protein